MHSCNSHPAEFVPSLLVRGRAASYFLIVLLAIALPTPLVWHGTSQAEEGAWVWQSVDQRRVHRFVLSPDFGQDLTLFAGVGTGDAQAFGVLRSTDGGISWEQLPGLSKGVAVRNLALSPDFSHDQTMFASVTRRISSPQEGAQGVVKSTDGGVSWAPAQQGITLTVAALHVLALAVSPSYPQDQMALVGMQTLGLFRTNDGGQSWANVWNGDGTVSVSAICFSPGFQSDKTVFLGTSGNGIFKSTDGGAAWNQVGKEFATEYLHSCVVSPSYAQDKTIFFGGGSGSVIRSMDAGENWDRASQGMDTGAAVWSLALSPQYAVNKTLYAGHERGQVFRSSDNGNSWEDLQSVSRRSIDALVAVPGEGGDVLLAAPTGEGIWKYSFVPRGSSEAAAATSVAMAAATYEATIQKEVVLATPVPVRPGPRNAFCAPVIFPILPLLGFMIVCGWTKRGRRW